MSNNLKIFLGVSYLLILFTFLYFVFTNIQINRLSDFSYYKELQTELDVYISANIILNLIFFFIFAIVWVALLGFGSPILILSGIFFGKWLGTFISVISISIGALLLYVIGNYFFRNIVKKILEEKFKKYIQIFQNNEFYYFFIYRLIGGLGVPFGLQNLIPILFGMKKINYFMASFFGFIPSFFITNTIGAGLNIYVQEAETFSMIDLIFTPEIYLPIMAFVILMILSLILKRKLFDEPSK